MKEQSITEIEIKFIDISDKELKIIAELCPQPEYKDCHLIAWYFHNKKLPKSTVRLRFENGRYFLVEKTPLKGISEKDQNFKICNEKTIEFPDEQSGMTYIKENYSDYELLMYIEKLRTHYNCPDYKIQIEIDSYPDIPPLIEIEGEKKDIIAFVEKIGLSLENGKNWNVFKLLQYYKISSKEIKFKKS